MTDPRSRIGLRCRPAMARAWSAEGATMMLIERSGQANLKPGQRRTSAFPKGPSYSRKRSPMPLRYAQRIIMRFACMKLERRSE